MYCVSLVFRSIIATGIVKDIGGTFFCPIKVPLIPGGFLKENDILFVRSFALMENIKQKQHISKLPSLRVGPLRGNVISIGRVLDLKPAKLRKGNAITIVKGC